MSKEYRSRNSVDQNNATSKPDLNHGQKDVFDESINAIKAHVKKMKNNSDKSNERSKQNQNMTDTSDSQCLKKRQIEITGGSMLNGIQERGINKDQNTKTKLFKYPGIFSINILDIIKPNLKKKSQMKLLQTLEPMTCPVT